MQARSSKDLLSALTERTRENLRIAETFLALPSSTLHQRPRPDHVRQVVPTRQSRISGPRPDHVRQVVPTRQSRISGPRPDAWNALECLAHLNKYSAYYLPEIRRQIATTKYRDNLVTFTSSWLGNKFAAGMKPGEKMRKISAPGNANPAKHAELVTESTLADFIQSQKETLELLKLAEQVDLTKTTTGTSLTSLLRLRLGDTLRVVIYHNWRHLEQALRAIE